VQNSVLKLGAKISSKLNLNKAGVQIRDIRAPFASNLKKGLQMQFNLSRAWFLAVYREGKKIEKNKPKRHSKIRRQESGQIGSISLSFSGFFGIFE
jgi:hypothetical protein